MWNCARQLLQPTARRRGIFPGPPESLLDATIHAKLKWAFTQNDEWGFGIFHEIIEDENGYHPVSDFMGRYTVLNTIQGRWFQNIEFINMLEEGMFDLKSPAWFGFIEATTDICSSWRMTECPTAHLFAVAISWVRLLGHISFIYTNSPSARGDWAL
jgi:hypothetical protein